VPETVDVEEPWPVDIGAGNFLLRQIQNPLDVVVVDVTDHENVHRK